MKTHESEVQPMDKYASLHETVRVDEFGNVTHGMVVQHMAANIRDGGRSVAVAPRVVHGRRFAPNVMPAGVDMNTTAPHDCRNHIREFETQRDAAARMLLDMPEAAVA